MKSALAAWRDAMGIALTDPIIWIVAIGTAVVVAVLTAPFVFV